MIETNGLRDKVGNQKSPATKSQGFLRGIHPLRYRLRQPSEQVDHLGNGLIPFFSDWAVHTIEGIIFHEA